MKGAKVTTQQERDNQTLKRYNLARRKQGLPAVASIDQIIDTDDFKIQNLKDPGFKGKDLTQRAVTKDTNSLIKAVAKTSGYEEYEVEDIYRHLMYALRQHIVHNGGVRLQGIGAIAITKAKGGTKLRFLPKNGQAHYEGIMPDRFRGYMSLHPELRQKLLVQYDADAETRFRNEDLDEDETEDDDA